MENKRDNDYFEERNKNNNIKIKAMLREELPAFCTEFFIGIEQRTSPLTRLNYAHDIRIFFNFLTSEIKEFIGYEISEITLTDLNRVQATHIEIFASYLNYYTIDSKEYTNSQSTKARKLAAVRCMFKYFYNKDKLDKDVAAKVSLPKLHSKPIIRLENDEVSTILSETESGINLSGHQKAFHERTKLRDLAIITLFLGTGIRISELVGLNVDDIDFYNNAFVVTRKGGNQEILYFNDEVAIALLEYVEKRYEFLDENSKEDALFLSLQKKRITVRAVEMLVKKYAKLASPLKKITPHKLRSTFGTNLYRETKDIYVVAEVLGHKDINVTKKHYADTSDDIKRSAANRVKLYKDNEEE